MVYRGIFGTKTPVIYRWISPLDARYSGHSDWQKATLYRRLAQIKRGPAKAALTASVTY